MAEKRERNSKCEPFLQGTKVREIKSPSTLRLEVNAERRIAILKARTKYEMHQFRNSVLDTSTPRDRRERDSRSRSRSGDSRSSDSQRRSPPTLMSGSPPPGPSATPAAMMRRSSASTTPVRRAAAPRSSPRLPVSREHYSPRSALDCRETDQVGGNAGESQQGDGACEGK